MRSLYTNGKENPHIEMPLNTPIKIANLSGTSDDNYNYQLISQIAPKSKIIQVKSITDIIDTPDEIHIPIDIE
jgi:hypothetical protein